MDGSFQVNWMLDRVQCSYMYDLTNLYTSCMGDLVWRDLRYKSLTCTCTCIWANINICEVICVSTVLIFKLECSPPRLVTLNIRSTCIIAIAMEIPLVAQWHFIGRGLLATCTCTYGPGIHVLSQVHNVQGRGLKIWHGPGHFLGSLIPRPRPPPDALPGRRLWSGYEATRTFQVT